MSDKITYKEYWDEIESIVNEYQKEEHGHDDFSEYLHEYIDGHEWIIYYHHHFVVLEHCENTDYGLDECLIDLNGARSLGDVTTPIAFWAMYADCMGAYSEKELVK